MARPKLEIDPKLVRDLASIGCKNTEIASIIGCSVDTLDRRFADELDKGRSHLRASLRRWQIEACKRGNIAMLIFLGKQLLGQSDKVEQVAHVEVKQLTPGEIEKIMLADPFQVKADK